MTLGARFFVLRASLTLRQAERRRRRQLENELASYATNSDLDDLGAILDRYPDNATHELREILAGQEIARLRQLRWP